MTCAPNSSRPELHARVTQQILSDLKQGVRPWVRPWSSRACGPVSRPLRHNRQPYGGINVLLLWTEAVARGYASPIWMTFRQALALGAHVRKGEHGATVVYAGQWVSRETDAAAPDAERRIPFLKAYTVFNVEQIEGLPDAYRAAQVQPSGCERVAAAEAFFEAVGPRLGHGGDQAYYAPAEDRIQMPPFAAFNDAEAYYATLAHECVHWTGHPDRLARDFGCRRFGDAGYAREELVAELGAAFLCADLGLELTPREDHAAYICHWLAVLAGDPKVVFTAAAQAQRAVDHLHGRQPGQAAAAPTGGG